MVTSYVESEARDWHVKHGKPVLMSEYGSDTVEGLHILPAYVWSEEFQVNSLEKLLKFFHNMKIFLPSSHNNFPSISRHSIN
jgi:beta-glucuronidase